jgi:hypothetical protein
MGHQCTRCNSKIKIHQFQELIYTTLINAPLDWEKLDNGITGEVARNNKKILRPHQTEALTKTHNISKIMTEVNSLWLVVQVKHLIHCVLQKMKPTAKV